MIEYIDIYLFQENKITNINSVDLFLFHLLLLRSISLLFF